MRTIASLQEQGVSESEINQVLDEVERRIDTIQMPKIAIIGFTGVGKSTTLDNIDLLESINKVSRRFD